MRSKIAQRILAKIPDETKIFVDKYADLVVRINQILREKGYSQKYLAEKLEKQPSEISKWLGGDHNFTLRSIAKLEAELGETLLEVPQRKKDTEFVFADEFRSTTFRLYKNLNHAKANKNNWKSDVKLTEVRNVAS